MLLVLVRVIVNSPSKLCYDHNLGQKTPSQSAILLPLCVCVMPICQQEIRLKEFRAGNQFEPTQPTSTVPAQRTRTRGCSQPTCTVGTHEPGDCSPAVVRQLARFGVWFWWQHQQQCCMLARPTQYRLRVFELI